jgi:adenosine deaminase
MRQMDSDAGGIVRALDAQPRWLNTLRGVDIAGVEEEQPLWVSAETLRRVRTRSSEIAGRRPRLKLEPLRLTLHAGEDFDWLTSGVRAVAEPFHWKLIERGDRIGHGIAITFDPKEWWKRKDGQVAPVKRIDRLLDLAFLAEYTSKHRSADQDEWLLEQIRTVVEELGFEGKLDSARAKVIDVVETARNAWRELGGRTLRRLAERSSRRSDLDKHEKWIHSYLWNRSTQKLAHQHIRLKVDNDRGDLRIVSQRTECDLLVIARRRLIREVARWQVCIESNPSSNLVVGGLDAMGAAQDFLQRRPTRNERQELETLTWTISTDDPITFSTTLADEYAYAWAGMVLRKDKPYDPSYARALLDEAAATSMRTRFTIPREDQARTGKDTGKRRGNARSA